MNKNLLKIVSYLLLVLFLTSACKALKPSKVDARKRPADVRERAMQNIKEGKGISLGGIGKNSGTNYEFSTSNPMWRASLEVLDFLPLSNVDYSGGVIITDWYNDSSSINDSVKITIRFLSNEIKSNSLKVIIHKKTCDSKQNCSVNQIQSKIQEELIASILRNAALLEKEIKKKN